MSSKVDSKQNAECNIYATVKETQYHGKSEYKTI